MSMKKSDVNILIMLVGILIPVAVYFFLYNSYTEKTAALNASSETLQVEVDYLKDLADHKQQYIDDTATMQLAIAEVKTHFPAEYRPEDDIIYIIGVENEQGAEVSSISMSESRLVEIAAVAAEEVAEGGEVAEAEAVPEGDSIDEGSAPSVQLYATTVGIAMDSSYRSLKDVINKINQDEFSKSIDGVSVVFDVESGKLGSTMSFTAYSLTGTDAEYTTPFVPGVFYGTTDIFNTGDKSAAIAAEKKAEEEAAEATAE